VIKTTLLGSALAVALSAGSVIAAEDFHALAGLQATPAPLQDGVLATTEGGATCDATTVDSAGGVALCAFLTSGASGGAAAFTVANELPVTAAQFLQVVN
jgi:hypothetical protein